MGLILDSSLLIADEREDFNLPAWLRTRPPEPVAVSAITWRSHTTPVRPLARQAWKLPAPTCPAVAPSEGGCQCGKTSDSL